MIQKVPRNIFLQFFFIITSIAWLNPNFAGYFQISGSTTNSNSGLYFYTGGKPITQDATGFYLTPGWTAADEGVLSVRGLTIRYQQSWSSLVISATTIASGTYDVRIINKSGIVVSEGNALTGNYNLNLANITEIENDESIELEITIRGDVLITLIQLSYDGNSIFCYPTPFTAGSGSKMGISYDLPADAKVTIQILDNGGKEVKRLLFESLESSRISRFENLVTWDGRDNTGRYVATGIYVVRISVRFVDSSSGQADYEDTFRFLVLR